MSEEKKNKKKRINPEKFINLEPTISEAKNATAVIAFGRFVPPTIGHEKLVDKVISEAKSRQGSPLLFASHTFDKKKNPLPYESKIKYLQKAFGRMVQKTRARTIIEIAKELSSKFDNLVLIVGSDRVEEFDRLLSKYNNKEYTFETIQVISAGERDPDSEDVSGMSASKLRTLAIEGNFDAFKKGLPSRLQTEAKSIYQELRTNMGLDEDLNIEEETLDERAPLTIQQRRQRARTMRRYKSKIARARERAKRRKASPEKLKIRAKRRAREILRKRLAAGKDYGDMSASEKVQLDKRLHRIPTTVINRIATRQLPQVRKAEMQRLAAVRNPTKTESLNKVFEAFLSEKEDKTSHPYHRGVAPSTADKRQAHFNKGAEKDPGDPSAYKPAPGDAAAETKPSKHTKRYHQLFTKEGAVKHDRRFKFYRKKENEYFKEDADLITENEKGLRKKASETGISYGILKKVFDRGVAAWRTGHRPGTTPSQWGMARVNSFATGGKTRQTTDADLWRQHKGKSESFLDDAAALMEEVETFIAEQTALERAKEAIRREKESDKIRHDRMKDTARRADAARRQNENVTKSADDPCWDGYVKLGTKKKNGKEVPNCVPESVNPADREEGTDSLVKIYKKNTPGQKTESYFSSDIPNKYGDFARGSRVKFTAHSMDMVDDNEEKEGTVVGTTLQYLRVRDDAGILYRVRHKDADLLEATKSRGF